MLNSFYDLDFTKIDFEERKKTIVSKKTILYGPRKCGKSYLIYDYLSNFKTNEYLYIDFNDLKIFNFNFYDEIQIFIDQNKIKILVLDNFNNKLDLPKCDTIIVANSKKIYIKDFDIVKVFPVDFKEFLLIDKHQNITSSFNYFFKYGNLIKTIKTSEQNRMNEIQETIKLISNNETELEIYKSFIYVCGESKSLNQIYLSLKSRIKISKDRFYKFCNNLKKNMIIFFVEKFNHPHMAKKVYIYNHAFIAQVNHKKNFNNIFDNMIFLELKYRYKEIYYTNDISFYVKDNNEIILAKPFFTNFQLSSKIISFIYDYNIQKIVIVTVNNSDTIIINNIKCIVVPFYNWAIKLD